MVGSFHTLTCKTFEREERKKERNIYIYICIFPFSPFSSPTKKVWQWGISNSWLSLLLLLFISYIYIYIYIYELIRREMVTILCSILIYYPFLKFLWCSFQNSFISFLLHEWMNESRKKERKEEKIYAPMRNGLYWYSHYCMCKYIVYNELQVSRRDLFFILPR
jgi:hypothetical protein